MSKYILGKKDTYVTLCTYTHNFKDNNDHLLQSSPKKGCVAWDEEECQKGKQYRLARFVNLVGLLTSVVVCISLLSGIGVVAARGKQAALLK